MDRHIGTLRYQIIIKVKNGKIVIACFGDFGILRVDSCQDDLTWI